MEIILIYLETKEDFTTMVQPPTHPHFM